MINSITSCQMMSEDVSHEEMMSEDVRHEEMMSEDVRWRFAIVWLDSLESQFVINKAIIHLI